MDALPVTPAFVLAVVLMWAAPGPAMTVLLRTAALRGLPPAAATIAGLEIGLYAWALLAAAGAAALVATSELAFVALRAGGAVVLIVLGVRALRQWRRPPDVAVEETPLPPNASPGLLRGLATGLVVQLANPKTATLLIAFYPQFVPRERPLLATTALLAVVQVAIELILYLILAAFVARAGVWFRRPAVRRRLEAVSGTTLVALGVRVAALHR